MRFVLSVSGQLVMTPGDWTTSEPLFYELYGEKLVAAGRYERVIRYREHMLPLAQRDPGENRKRRILRRATRLNHQPLPARTNRFRALRLRVGDEPASSRDTRRLSTARSLDQRHMSFEKRRCPWSITSMRLRRRPI